MQALLPTLHGTIDRRMLINFRVRPEIARALLPNYFRPKLVGGWAIAGICLIRLKEIRPRGIPARCGITSENAAHRIAIEWNENDAIREGVFIPRRDTSSALQALAGGRVFPGVHHVAEFQVEETEHEFNLRMNSSDGTFVTVRTRLAGEFPKDSIFKSLDEASEFFARGAVGYSATKDPNCCDGLELCTARWQVEPLDVLLVKSSFFEDESRFPKGSVHFDCALLMRNIEHEWRVLPRMEK